MKIEISLSRKIGLGFAAGLLVLIFVGIVSFLSTQHFTRAAAMVAQSHQVMMLLEATLGDVVTAESESRGFILAGDVSFLKVYEQNVMDTAEDLQQLHLLVIDRNIHEKLNEFEQLIKARLTRIEYFVELRKAQGFGDVFTSGLNIGKQMMDNLRKVTDEVEDMERHLIVEREQRMQALARSTILVIVLGSLLATLLAAFSMVAIVADIRQREHLEREVLEISEREQRRIGQDLHDGVCQHLTGISLLSRSLQQKLADRAAAETAEAARITGLINDGIEQTRRVTHGLHPVANEVTGLMVALQELANSVHAAERLACLFECPEAVLIPDQMAATHLYRITQEAVQNAIRHAQPTVITIRLDSDETAITLTITDDGCGLPDHPKQHKGLGLDIMNYRAHTLGATLTVKRGVERGTVVRCVMPRSGFA